MARIPTITTASWLLLALLTACAPNPEPGGGQACALRPVAEIPLGVEQGFITAPALIQDKPVTVIIDTGSEGTLVTPGAVEAYQLQRDPRRRTVIQGVGGAFTSQNARLQSFGIGGMEMLDQSYSVGTLPGHAGSALHAAGLLGADWLGDFDVDMDLPHRRLTLYRAPGCTGDYLPWTQPRTSLRVTRAGRGLMLLPVVLDGAPVTALLDSGAVRTVVAQPAALRAGATGAALEHDPVGRSTGIDGIGQVTRQHRFALLAIGPEQVRDATLVVAPLRGAGGAEMLLGLDWLRAHRVWIAYRDRRIYVQRGSAAG